MNRVLNVEKEFVKKVEDKFEQRKLLAGDRAPKLFEVFEQELSWDEAFALKFLYAQMPMHDMANYDGELFLKYVRHAFDVKNKTTWGGNMDTNIFLYYVLAYRVNNEDIDGSREVMCESILLRIKDMSMYDAILEVNHWCHEHANYISTDIRTASPSTVIKSGRGRCGEESVLLTSVLRSVGIPARQCYVPRWSHCDDNHAWVEAYADGVWYFLGACEPEPRLNEGWFSELASKAMLVHTKVIRGYEGEETKLKDDNVITELNLLDRYADTKKLRVVVIDQNGNKVYGAAVHFQVFNYNEFSDVACVISDKNGEASFVTGFGDIMIHACYEGNFGYKKVCVKDYEVVEICISSSNDSGSVLNIEMNSSNTRHIASKPYSEEELSSNASRMKHEDEMRKAYEDSFIGENEVIKLADRYELPRNVVLEVIQGSRGNCNTIKSYIENNAKEYGHMCLALLLTLSKKDLIDVTTEVLEDHLFNVSLSENKIKDDFYCSYVLCPRVGNEKLSSYRKFFREKFNSYEINDFKHMPEKLVAWIDNSIEVTEEYCYFKGMAYPVGTIEIGKADAESRDVLFVSMARSFGIAARLNPYDKMPEYYSNGWNKALFKNYLGLVSISMGKFSIVKATQIKTKIEYYNNFTISRLENGIYKTLDLTNIPFKELSNAIEVPCGEYRLITGKRFSEDLAKVRIQYFNISKNNTVELTLKYPDDNEPDNIYGMIDKDDEQLIRLCSNSCSILMWIDAAKEPSKHLMHEISILKNEFESFQGRLCVLSDKADTKAYVRSIYQIPDNIEFYCDENFEKMNKILKYIKENKQPILPFVCIIDKANNVTYVSSGYKPERGNEILMKTRRYYE